MVKRVSLVLLIVGAVLLAGCSDLAVIEITHDYRSNLEVGETVNLTAEGKSGMDTAVRLNEVTWTVNDESLASVTGDGLTAVLTALRPGEVVVTAEADGVSGSITFNVSSELPNPVVYEESFEDFEVGQYPDGWIVTDREVHDGTGYSGGRISTERASDGSKSVKIVSVPDAEGRVDIEFDEPLLYHSLTVDIYKDPDVTENANLEFFSESGRLFGLFMTQSGNVGHRRPDGSNKPYTHSMPNGQWNTVEFQWNDATKKYKVFIIVDGVREEVTPAGGEDFEEAARDGQVIRFSAAVTKRDMDKTIYIDNIRVVDLAVQELLEQ